MYADYHEHTSFSYDCGLPMETAVKRAIAIGVEDLCFTEHIDIGTTNTFLCDCQAYFREFSRLKALYGDKIKLKVGMEFGMQSHTIPQYQKIFDRYEFDFILLSMHQIGNKEFWSGAFQRGKSQKQYMDEYYDELFKIVSNYNDYSVLGHVDVIRRYDDYGVYPFEKVKDKLEQIFKVLIANGKGIEVNTSCYRYNIGDLMPSVDIIKFYRELGGEVITVGADSHYAEHVGYKVLETQQRLKEFGFKYICTFDKMKPEFHSL